MTLLILKAQIKGANTADLFAVPVVVAGHVAGGRAVAPYVAIRHKAPPEIAHTRALIVPAHKPEPLAEQIARDVQHVQAVIDDYKAKQATELERGPGNNAFVYDPMIAKQEKDKAALEGIIAHLAPKPAPVFGVWRVSPEHTEAIIGRLIADHATDLSDAELERILSPPTVGGAALVKMAQHLRDTGALTPAMIPYQAPDPGPPMVVTTMPAVDIKAAGKRKAQADKLREGAASHLAQAEEDLGRDRQSNTARRARMAAGSIKDAQQRALIAGTMNNIADLIEAGEAVHLAGISTRAQVEALDLAARQSVYAWERDTNQPYHGDREIIPELKHIPHAKLPGGEWNVKERARLERVGLKTDQDIQAALQEYLPLRGERLREDPIKAAERALVGTKPGIDFFPTPPPLAQRMVQLAGINPGDRVLEPSAGKGDIADAIRAAGGKVEAVELSNRLRKVLEAKGHALVGTDFEAFDSHEGQYDAIVMNPPWSGGADVRHVMRAFTMLKPGGRLVALMSMHPSFARDKASQAFRAWLADMDADTEELPAGDFKSQWMSGGIPSWLVRVERPMTKALFLLKAQIKGAGTSDLFAEPVHVSAYIRDGHTVRAHTEVRQVRHEAPPAPTPAYPAKAAVMFSRVLAERLQIPDMSIGDAIERLASKQGWPTPGRMIDTLNSPTFTSGDFHAALLAAWSDADLERATGHGRDWWLNVSERLSVKAPPAPTPVEVAPKPVIITKPSEPDHITKPLPPKPEWKMTVEDLHPSYRAKKYGDLTMSEFLRQAQIHEAIGAASRKDNPNARKAAFERAKTQFNPGAYHHMHPSFEPAHIAQGRANLGELRRDKKYDVPVPVVSKPAVDSDAERRQNATLAAGAKPMFKHVTAKSERDGTVVYRKVVADAKPHYQGSGRQIEEITVHGADIFSRMRHGSTHKHVSLDAAAAHLGWERI